MGKISQETIDKIPVLYQELKTKKKVAEELGISIATVSKYLMLHDVAVLPEMTAEELKEQVNEEFARTLNVTAAGRKFGLSSDKARGLLTTDNLAKLSQENEDRDSVWYYILKLFGVQSEEEPVLVKNIHMMQRYKEQGISYRAQLLTLKYCYEVKHMSTKKANNGIGIIKYCYLEAAAYYKRQADKIKQIDEAIQRQLEKDRIEIPYKPYYSYKKSKAKKLIDLNTLGE